MGDWGESWNSIRPLRSWGLLHPESKRWSELFVLNVIWRAQTNFIHFGELLTIHLVNVLLASYVPDLDCFISSHGNSKRPILWCFNRVYISLMSLQVCDVLPLFCVPDLHIIFHQASREKDSWIKRMEANSSNDGFMPLQLHLKWVVILWLVSILVKVFWSHQDFYHFIIWPCGYQIWGSAPIHTVNWAIMVIVLLIHNLNPFGIIGATLRVNFIWIWSIPSSEWCK